MLGVVVADEADDVAAGVFAPAWSVDAPVIVQEVGGEVEADDEGPVVDEMCFNGVDVVGDPAPVRDFDGAVFPAGEALVGEVLGPVGVWEAAFVGDACGHEVVAGVVEADVAFVDGAAGVEVDVGFGEVWHEGGVGFVADFGFEGGAEGVAFAGGCGDLVFDGCGVVDAVDVLPGEGWGEAGGRGGGVGGGEGEGCGEEEEAEEGGEGEAGGGGHGCVLLWLLFL